MKKEAHFWANKITIIWFEIIWQIFELEDGIRRFWFDKLFSNNFYENLKKIRRMKNSYNMYNNLFNRIRKNFHIHNNYTQQSYLPRIIIPWKKKSGASSLNDCEITYLLAIWNSIWKEEQKRERLRLCITPHVSIHWRESSRKFHAQPPTVKRFEINPNRK